MNNQLLKNVIFNEITNELDNFKNENLYQCQHCGKIFEWNDVDYNPEENSYTCPECRTTFNEEELQNASVIDYIEEWYLTYKGEEQNDR